MHFLKVSLGEKVGRRTEYYATIAGENCTLLPITTSEEPVRADRRSVKTLVANALAMLWSSVLWRLSA